ncbi:ret finger protein-like 4B [Equus caballus]|uniref:Ret finger protein like 4B n=1 Tax=Equus caballus TaxID=9796 RepID=A0A5F5PIT1_HORSE|nr:ret finger protein-like 4B [Equus caballus]
MARSLKEGATCPICLELFFKPAFLSCMHTFCFDCIGRWMLERDDLKLICPMCRGVNKKLPLLELKVSELTLLVKQHSPLLELSLHVSEEFLRFQEDVTLSTVTANSLLVLSEDLKNVWCGKICHNRMEDPQRFAHLPCVLGTPSFSSGRHYWEVEVGEGKEWALGVCKESVDRKRKSGFSSEHGFWIISMKAGAIYASSIPQTKIPASSGLSRVGIFLDVEMEEIKFFDVRNDALIYIHSPFTCLEPLCPFFRPELPGESDHGAPLSICP